MVNIIILTTFLLLFGYGAYVLWDSAQVCEKADFRRYEVYNPEKDDGKSFQELVSTDSEVLGWITVYDTHIDYPFAQTDNNDKYVNTDIEGKYSLAGSIFLDYRNKNDFSDEVSILYGHHMAKRTMFGDVEQFQKQEYLDTHTKGNLYYGGKNHEVEFFAFLKADAYDGKIYNPELKKEEKEEYLQRIYRTASCVRQIEIREGESLLLLSTCTSDSTNGRYILVGKIFP